MVYGEVARARGAAVGWPPALLLLLLLPSDGVRAPRARSIMSRPRIISCAELAEHTSLDDCWLAVDGMVCR